MLIKKVGREVKKKRQPGFLLRDFVILTKHANIKAREKISADAAFNKVTF